MIDGPRVVPPGVKPRSLVILLHGYGANGDDLISLAPYWRAALPETAFAAPNAPQPCPGAPGGYQWWALASVDRNARAAGVAQAAPVLDAFVNAELDRYGLTEAQLALVGFSQGTMMALHVGPRRRTPLAGIVGFSGMLADGAALDDPAINHPPVLLVHGDADPMIPVAALFQAKQALERHGFAVESHVSPGLGHGIDPAGVQLGGRFLARVLG
ncbi:MAG TPA: dienelactone hydrolase family protein [Caulobacteraceae bacterium]|nr:dienelactone hydrolase family protein [Caulobacteraceae bacterium]